MINLFYETNFKLEDSEEHNSWLMNVAKSEEKAIHEINYIFCDDEYLLKINQEYLNHNTYTDIISFDNSVDDDLAGDIFVSIDRVKDNAQKFEVSFIDELRRVMVHGLLHFMGYKDKTKEESLTMREKENEKLKLFHVEH